METLRPFPLSPSERLWSPRQIALAAFLGSPLAAGWCFSRNYDALSRLSDSRRSFWLGIAATAAVVAICFALPRNFPNFIIPAAYTYAIERYASRCFGTIYSEHVANGGAKGSWWGIVGISLASLAVLIALLIVIVYLLASWAPQLHR
jgi:hypothetical protein